MMKALQSWYSMHCNGQWEKTNGVQIDTVSEGGWFVRINMTPAEIGRARVVLVPIYHSVDVYPTAWISLECKDHYLAGMCAPNLFVELIERIETVLSAIE